MDAMPHSGLTIIAADEAVPVFVLQLPVDILFRLLHGDVHVPIKAGQDACRIREKSRGGGWAGSGAALAQGWWELNWRAGSRCDRSEFSCIRTGYPASPKKPQAARTSIVHARVELYDDGFALDALEKVGRGFGARWGTLSVCHC